MCMINIYAPIGISAETPEELSIAVTVKALKNQGIDIQLIRYEDTPQAYMDGLRVEEVLLQDGPDVFPITVVDGEVFQKNTYPEFGELLAWSASRPLEEIQ